MEHTRLRDIKVGARDLFSVKPGDIFVEDGHNPRDYNLPENRTHIDTLKASIRIHGVKKPLEVRWCSATKRAILVDGECRLRATMELIAEGVPIESVSVYQVQGGNEADRLVTALVANTGKPLSSIECGAAYQRLVNYGWTIEKVAESLSVKPAYVQQCIELSDAPIAVKVMVSKGTVTPALALAELREKGSDAEASLNDAVAKAGGKVAKRARAKVFKFSKELRASVKLALEAAAEGKPDAQALASSVLQLWAEENQPS